MTEVGSAYVSILPSMKGFGSKVAAESNKAGASAGKSAGSTFASGFKSFVGPAALGLAAIGAAKVFAGFVSDARESAKVGAITASVIKSTGGAAGLSAKQVGKLSTAISNKTGIDDEAIQSNANVLLTFTKVHDEVGRGNNIFSRATGLAQDMATVMGTDAKGASMQLGKALNDPIKGITALSRAGVSFTQGQKDQIKKLVEQGDVLKAQKIILREVGKEFGGAAAAAATPMDKLKVTLGNLGEEIGTALLPMIDRAATFLAANLPAAIAFAKSAFGRIKSAAQTAFGFFETNVLPVLQSVAGFIMGTVVPVVGGVLKNALGGAKSAFKSIGDAIQRNKPQLESLLGAFKTLGRFILTQVVPLLGPVLKAAFKILGTTIGVAIDVIGNLWGAFKFLARIALDALGLIVHGAAKALGWIPGVGGKLKKASDAFDAFRGRVLASFNGLGGKGEALGRDFANGLAAGIRQGGDVAVAVAQGVANRVAAGYAAAQQSNSPSKVAIKLGADFSHGIAVGIRKGGKSAIAAVSELVDKVAGKLDSLRDAAASVRTSVADSVKGIVDVSAIATPIVTGQDADGNDITRTPPISETFAGFAAQAKAFAAALAEMARKKVSPAIIAAIAASGPASGLTAAQAFASAPAAEIASVNASMGEIQSAARAAGNTVLNTTRIPADIKREQAQLDALNRIEGALKANNVAEIRVRNGDELYVVFKRAEQKAARRG